MKKLRYLLLPLFLCVSVITGCVHGKLEQGGAYAPVDANGAQTIAPDFEFYIADATYKTVHSAGMAVFQFELDNRTALYKISPNIKKELDKLRPQFWQYNGMYLRARHGYLLNPTPAGLDAMNSVLAKIKQLSQAAQEIVPQLLK